MAQKILVCGDVSGSFRFLFQKVETLNKKKGPFDFLLCVGNFFGQSPSNWEPFKSGLRKVPIPTYILGPNSEDQIKYYDDLNGCELCPNVYHLGKRGILTTGGLKIAYVSGVENATCDDAKLTQKDVQTVRDIAYKGVSEVEYLGIDALITSVWPKNVTNLVGSVSDDVKNAANNGSELVAWLASQLKPRYHFAGLSDLFYERQPYRNHQPNAMKNAHCTRFIALSSVNGKKWIYGAELTPINKIAKDKLYERTLDETESPYSDVCLVDQKNQKQYFFDMNSRDKGQVSRKRKRDISQDKCWFCLAGGQDLQTIVSIGVDAYAAVPKGGLARRHLIICPVKHLESYLHLPQSARGEVGKMKEAVTKYYSKFNEVPVFFERYFKTSHMQLNAVPVPSSCQKRLKNAFQRCAEGNCLDLIEMPAGAELDTVVRLNTPYLYIELPDGVRFYLKCNNDFPINFARSALAGKDVLNAMGKVEWKKCVLGEEEEQKLTRQLREEFSEFYSTD